MYVYAATVSSLGSRSSGSHTESELSPGGPSFHPAYEETHTSNQSRTAVQQYISVDFLLLPEEIKAVCSDHILSVLHADEFQALHLN